MSKEQKGPAPGAPASERVRAAHLGFYRGNRIKPGRTFTLLDPKDFSPKWMERVDDSVPDDFAAVHVPKRRARTGDALSGIAEHTVASSKSARAASGSAEKVGGRASDQTVV